MVRRLVLACAAAALLVAGAAPAQAQRSGPAARPARADRAPRSTRPRKPRPWARRKVDTAWGTREDIYGGYSTPGGGLGRPGQLHQRLQTLTGAPSDAREVGLTVSRGGGRSPVHLRMTENVELERRLSLTGVRRAAGDLPDGMTWTAPVRVKTHRDLVANVLDRFVTDGANSRHERIAGSHLMLAPLASRYQHAHRSFLPENGYAGPIAPDDALAARFTQEITGKPMRLHDGRTGEAWATVQRNYIVGIQHESATYYDTPDGAAEKRELALRVKSWHPLDEGGRVTAPTARGLFVKETLSRPEIEAMGVAPGDFTARREAHADLPLDLERGAVRDAVAAAGRQYGLSESEAGALRPVTRVETQRASIDLLYRGDGPISDPSSFEKVGFLVVDVYKTVDLRPRRRRRTTARAQFEIELLPEGRQRYRENPAEFRRLFSEIEKAYGASLDPLPKYQHR